MKNTITTQLRTVLATNLVLYYKTQAFHWNVEGKAFFALHDMFETLYTQHYKDTDSIAERIRQLGEYPPLSLAELLPHSNVQEAAAIGSDDMVAHLIADYGTYIALLKESLALAEEDDTSQALLSDILAVSESHLWMLNAYNA